MSDDFKKLLEEEQEVDKELAKPMPGSASSEGVKPASKTTKKATLSSSDERPEVAAAEAQSEEPAQPETSVGEEATESEPRTTGGTETAPAEVKTVAAVSEKGTGGKKLPGHIVLEQSDDPRAKWYVIHTYSGHEARVAENLKQRVQTLGITGQVLEMFIPTQDKIEIRAGKKHAVTEKIFPGYLLVRMILTDPTWLAVRTTPGVTGFVGTGNKPTPLSDAEVATIQKFAAIGAPKFKTKFSVGEAVRIVDGPFADYLGSIGSIDEEKGKLRVLVSIFGRETPVELDFLQVTKI